MRRFRMNFVLVLFHFLLAYTGQLLAQPSSMEVEEWIEVDSVPADFPVSFEFVEQGEWQFIAYYNKHRNLSVASRKLPDETWCYKVLPSKVGWDSHNRIEMTMDRDNCLHVTGNMHNDSLTYFITEKPFDINSFRKVFPQVKVEDELRCTYPKFLKTSDERLIYSYRKGGSGNGITITNRYDEQSKSFIRLSDKPLFDGLGQMSAYASGPGLGPDGYYHVSWLWRDTPSCETNHDLSYAKSKDLIAWETIEGELLELPITPKHNEYTVDPVPAGGGVINGGHKLFFASDNSALIAYMKYDAQGNNQYYLAKEEQGQWKINQVSEWDFRWEFSGPGSIDFQIKLKNAKVNEEGQVSIIYWHKEYGHGELVVDLKTLNLIGNKPIKPRDNNAQYPEQLRKSERTDGTFQVHWLKSKRKGNDDGEFYVLRWETMGKRRFYKAPEEPVKSSSLKLYKFLRK